MKTFVAVSALAIALACATSAASATEREKEAVLGSGSGFLVGGPIGAVDQYLAENGRLTMIENTRDVHTKIKLVRWNRPATPEDRNCPVLECIVNNIVSVLDGKNRGQYRSQLQVAKRPDSNIGQA